MFKDQTNGIKIKEGYFSEQYLLSDGIGITLNLLGDGHQIPYFEGENTPRNVNARPMDAETQKDWLIVENYKNWLQNLRKDSSTKNQGALEEEIKQGNYQSLLIESHGNSINRDMLNTPFMFISTHLSHGKFTLRFNIAGNNLYSVKPSFPLRKEFKDVLTPGIIEWLG